MNSLFKGLALPLILLSIIIGLTISNSLYFYFDKAAIFGFSPIDWLNHINLPDNFVKDFPAGIAVYNSSLVMFLYPLMNHYLRLNPGVLPCIMIVLEILFFTLSLWVYSQSLADKSSRKIFKYIAIIVITLLLSSNIGRMDLSRIAVIPFFQGLYYNFADGARLLAVAFALKRKWLLSALFLALSTMSHPIMGMLGASFIFFAIVPHFSKLKSRQLLFASIFYLALVGFWALHILDSNQAIAAELVPLENWLNLTKLFSFHWYPYELGMLTKNFGEALLPFFGFVLLLYHYIILLDFNSELKKSFFYGFSGLLFLTCMGFLFSSFGSEPILIKLNLQRASHLIVSLGLPIVVYGLITETNSLKFLRVFSALMLLVSPFLSVAIFPFFAVILLLSDSILNDNKSKGSFVYLALIGSLIIFIGFNYSHIKPNLIHLIGHPRAIFVSLLSVFFLLMCKKKRTYLNNNSLLIFLIAIFSVFWIRDDFNSNFSRHSEAKNYLRAQLWAKSNTPSNSLFFIDPTICYGWRDFSQRSSFGCIREWLHTSWLYDSKIETYQEGLKRFGELGVNIPVIDRFSDPDQVRATIYKQVQDKFYMADDSWRKSMSAKYNVDYFVFNSNSINTGMQKVFENNSYVIYKAPDNQ